MLPIARTNVELFNFLIAQGRSIEELKRIATCYKFATRIYAGYHLEEGIPFVAHSVGTACIAAALGLSAAEVGAALLHNIFSNADFGDGRGSALTPRRRRQVREAVGSDVEALIVEFRDLRPACRKEPDPAVWCADLSGNRRALLLIEIADRLDHLSDRRSGYMTRNWDRDGRATAYDRRLAVAATLLGEHELAADLTAAIDDAPAARASVPEEVRLIMRPASGPNWIYPPSVGRRWLPALVARARMERARLGRLKRRLLGNGPATAPIAAPSRVADAR